MSSPPRRSRSRSKMRSSSQSSSVSVHNNTKDSQSKHIRSLKEKFKKSRGNLQQKLDEALEIVKETAELKEQNRKLQEDFKKQADELKSLKMFVQNNLNKPNVDIASSNDIDMAAAYGFEEYFNDKSACASTGNKQSDNIKKNFCFPSLPKPRQENQNTPILKLRLPPHQSRKATVLSQPSNDPASIPGGSNAQQTPSSANQPVDNSAKANLPKNKPPPILTSRLDIKAMVINMEQKLGHRNFHFRPAAKGDTSIITQSDEDFKATIELLKSSDIDGHAYTLKSERKLNVILRNLCPSYDELDIERGIIESQIDVRIHKIERYSTAKSKRQEYELNLWHIQLEPHSDLVSLLALKTLLNQRGIRFERMRRQDITQCRNCQDFNHSAINCFRKYRCVKCLTDHKHGECTKSATEPVGCINCGSTNHPANYRGCPVHLDLVKHLQEKKERERKAQAARQAMFNNYRHSNLSFAEATGSSRPAKNNHSSSHPKGFDNVKMGLGFDIQAECHAQFGMDFRNIRQRLSDFAPIYQRAEDKSIALLQFIASIHPDYNNV